MYKWFNEHVFASSVEAYLRGVADVQDQQCQQLVAEVEAFVNE